MNNSSDDPAEGIESADTPSTALLPPPALTTNSCCTTSFIEALMKIAIELIFFLDVVLTVLKLLMSFFWPNFNADIYSPYLMNDTDDSLPAAHAIYNIWRFIKKNKKSKFKYIVLTFLTIGQTVFNSLATYFTLHHLIFHTISFSAAFIFFPISAWFMAARLIFLAIRAGRKATISGLIKDRETSIDHYEKIIKDPSYLGDGAELKKKERLSFQLAALKAVNEGGGTDLQKLLVADTLGYEKEKRNLLRLYSVFTGAIAVSVTVMVLFPPAGLAALIMIAGVVSGSMLLMNIKSFCESLYSDWLVQKIRTAKPQLTDNFLKSHYFSMHKEKYSEANVPEYWDNLPDALNTQFQHEALFDIHNKKKKENRGDLICQWLKYEIYAKKIPSLKEFFKTVAVTLLALPFILPVAAVFFVCDKSCAYLAKKTKKETAEEGESSSAVTPCLA